MDVEEWATGWVGFIVAAAAVVTALGVLWRKAVKPTWRAVTKAARALNDVQEAMPVLLTIAEEFKPNGGHSLKDSLTRIEATQECIQDRLTNGRQQIVELVATVEAQGERLETLHTYAHDNSHRLSGSLTTMAEAYAGMKQQMGRMLAGQAQITAEQERVAAALEAHQGELGRGE